MDEGIGARLRQARTGRGLALEEIEEQLKIRARFLRALEEERWEILPGAAYARGFLRTYAEFLDLDPDRLVGEFRRLQKPEEEAEPVRQLSDEQLRVGLAERARRLVGAAGAAARRLLRPRRDLPSPTPAWLAPAVIAVVGVVAAVATVGLIIGSSNGDAEPAPTAPEVAEEEPGEISGASEVRPPRVELEVRATGTVWVCLVDHSGRPLVDGETLTEGADRGPFRARSFEVTFGNGQVEMTADGEPVPVPGLANPLGYRITPERARELDDPDRPTCT